MIPVQVLLSASSFHPLLHLHVKEPGVLVHVCRHPPLLARHSSTSVGRRGEGGYKRYERRERVGSLSGDVKNGLSAEQ